MYIDDELVPTDGDKNALMMIIKALHKAKTKHPYWPSEDIFHAHSILGEEYGESLRECVEYYNGKDESLNKIFAETSQTGAMCIRFLADFFDNPHINRQKPK